MSETVIQSNSTSVVASWIEKNIPSSLKPIRDDAFYHFRKLGLPGNKTEEYKHTPITRHLEKNFDFSLSNSPGSALDVSPFFIPDVDAYVVVLINGEFSRAHSAIDGLPSGVTVASLKEALKKHEQDVLEHIAKVADYKADPFAAWNTASWNDGVFIKVADNQIVEKPILIYHIHDVREGQVISVSRNLIIAGKNSEVTVLEKFDSAGSFNGFASIVTEGIVAENAAVNLYAIQNDQGNRYQHEIIQFQQANYSRVNTYTFTLDGKLIRNNLQLSLDGQGIESHMYGLYCISHNTLADNHTVVDHRQPHSFSNEMYKGIIDESAKGVFNGKIYVRPQAQKTNAFQANRNILLTDKATINTKPQLEIWADDVKCSHGCTSGQLDEEAMFYLQTRGIGKETARAIMLYAFAREVMENIKHRGIKTYIDQLISERLHKNF